MTTLEQTREKRLISCADGQEGISTDAGDQSTPADRHEFTAELSVDTVVVYDSASNARKHGSSGESPMLPGQVATFHELEVELLSGPECALQPIADILAQESSLTHHSESKLERALTLCATHPLGAPTDVSGLQPDMHMSEAARLILRTQFVAMLLSEAGVRYSSDIEFVHAMRVATRRSRVAAMIFGDFLRTKQLRRYVKQIRQTGRRLGKVRDLDVCLHNARRTAETNATLVSHWEAERVRAHQRLIRWLDSKKYRDFLVGYAKFCTTPGRGAIVVPYLHGRSPTPQIVSYVAPGLIVRGFEQVRSYEPLFAAQNPVAYETVHALRIDCKHLRYTLEFFHGLLGKDGRVLINRLKKLQGLLGNLNDAAVAAEMARHDGISEAAAEQHLAHQNQLLSELYARTPDALTQFTRTDTRKRLGRAIARF